MLLQLEVDPVLEVCHEFGMSFSSENADSCFGFILVARPSLSSLGFECGGI